MKVRIVFVVLLLAAVNLAAQTFRGTILGTVTDAQGAVVAGATGDGEERRHGNGAHHRDQRRRQLRPARVADWHLHVTITLDRLSDLCDHRCHRGRGRRTSRRCDHEARPGIDQSRSLG